MHFSEHPHGPSWIPVLAATLALLATVTGLVGGLRDTQSDRNKSEEIIAITRAGHAYNEALQLTARGDAAGEQKQLADANHYEQDADAANQRSEHLLVAHEIFAGSTTLFEIGIVLVTVRMLVTSRLLTAVVGTVAVAGLAAGVVAALF